MKHWAADLIGMPWKPEFNCWNLMQLTFKMRLDIDLPDEASGVLILSGAAHSTGMRVVDGLAQENDLVLMRCMDGRRHVGMFIQANNKQGVLHNDGRMTEFGPIGCVGFDTLRKLAEAGCKDFQYWRQRK